MSSIEELKKKALERRKKKTQADDSGSDELEPSIQQATLNPREKLDDR